MACAFISYQAVLPASSASPSRKLGAKPRLDTGTLPAAGASKVVFSSAYSPAPGGALSPFLSKPPWKPLSLSLGSRGPSRLSWNSIATSTRAAPESEEETEEEADISSEESDVPDDGAVMETGEQQINSQPLPRKKKLRGLNYIMQTLKNDALQTLSQGKEIPDIRTGDIVQLRVEVPDNKKRLSLYRGIVIAKHNAGLSTTFTIRRVIAGVGVEMVFPLYSPNIREIKVVNSRKVRRAKLYYLRHKLARLSTV